MGADIWLLCKKNFSMSQNVPKNDMKHERNEFKVGLRVSDRKRSKDFQTLLIKGNDTTPVEI